MASVRSVSRLLNNKTIGAIIKRGYADEMSFTLAAGNKVFYQNEGVRQVDVPSFSGNFGILPKHVPLLAVLKPGIVNVFENDGKVKKVFVSSGTITINDDSSVQILAEEAADIEDIDPAAAKEVLSKAQSEFSAATSEIDRARATIAIEVGEALVKASE